MKNKPTGPITILGKKWLVLINLRCWLMSVVTDAQMGDARLLPNQ